MPSIITDTPPAAQFNEVRFKLNEAQDICGSVAVCDRQDQIEYIAAMWKAACVLADAEYLVERMRQDCELLAEQVAEQMGWTA